MTGLTTGLMWSISDNLEAVDGFLRSTLIVVAILCLTKKKGFVGFCGWFHVRFVGRRLPLLSAIADLLALPVIWELKPGVAELITFYFAAMSDNGVVLLEPV